MVLIIINILMIITLVLSDIIFSYVIIIGSYAFLF